MSANGNAYAAKKQPSGVARWKVLWSPFVLLLLLIMFCIEFVKGALLVSVLPVYFSSVLGWSAYTLGWAFAVQYVGDNVFRGPVGWLIDAIGYRTTMAAGLAIACGAVGMIAALQTVGWVVAACFLLGAGTSPLWPCVVAGTTGEAGEQAQGTMMSAVYSAWMAGAGAGPAAINWFVRGTDMSLPFRLLVGLSAAAFAVSLFLPRRGRAGAGAGVSGSGTKEGAGRGQRPSLIAAFRDVRAGALLYPAMFLQTFALGVLTPIVTLYAREDLALSANEFSLLLLTGGAATLLLLFPVGRWTDRYGTRPFLHVGIPAAAAATAALTLVSTRGQLFAAVIAVGIGYAFLIPSWNAFIAKTIPKERRGAVWGAFLTIEGAGFVVGPVVSGWLWDHAGHRTPFLVSGGVLAVLFVLHLFISLRKPIVIR